METCFLFYFILFKQESKVAHTGYALEFLGNSLRTLENFFGRQYQLLKVDLIAIPDFAMGAMENWGLITFREQYLIYEEGVTTARTKQNIADLITHELTHMWFGNEVTPEWWTYLWLSEGFARYFEYYITSQVMNQIFVKYVIVPHVFCSTTFSSSLPGTSGSSSS